MTNQDTYRPTAEQAYQNDREQMLAKLETLEWLLKKSDASQAKSPESWGHAGNLGYVNNTLDEIIRFLS